MAEIEFANLNDFVLHLAETVVAIEEVEHRALKKCAEVIEKDAKNRIGEYQPTTGPFPAWEPLADSTEQEKARLGYPVDAPLLRKGNLRDSIRHEVSGHEAVIGSQSGIAAYQEFGTEQIPPRPFIGPAAFDSKDKVQKILGAAIVGGLAAGRAIHPSLGYDFETD